MSNKLAASLLALSILFSCSNSKNSESDIKFQQYFVHGEQLYIKHCSNCHQPTGTGLGLVYPPLHTSDFMNTNFEKVLCLMKYGIKGEIIVNGKSYIQHMPGVQSLTDIEIAEIATYIYNTWSHSKGLVDVKDASRILAECNEELK
jgi:cytochrome c551